MKLFYSPNACSLAPHIVLRELEIPFELIRVDLQQHLTELKQDFYQLNSKGQVPLLQLKQLNPLVIKQNDNRTLICLIS